MNRLEQLLTTERPWLTDGGLETYMIFGEGLELPSFAAFVLLDSEEGRAALERYFDGFIDLAEEAGTGFVLDTVTWRAGARWGEALGLDEAAIRGINDRAVRFARGIRARRGTAALPILINGVVGPCGDGYSARTRLSAEEARSCHQVQVDSLAQAGVDLVTATTMTHSDEAIGVLRAAARAGVPAVVSFTVETDGALPSGETLAEATDAVLQAGSAPLYFMVNCAHPTHFEGALARGEAWTSRLGGLRANASRLSHAELDEAVELDDGDPLDLGCRYSALQESFPSIHLLGGCCGTDHRHVGAIRDACLSASA